MNHPLIAQLDRLSELLLSNPQAATQEAKSLDKVAKALAPAILALEGAAAGASPKAQELTAILGQMFGSTEDKEARAVLKPVLDKLPPKKAGMTTLEHMRATAIKLVADGKADRAQVLIQKHLSRPRFDPKVSGEYELLKQIRMLGRMSKQEQNAAKEYLLSKPELVTRLCDAASIKTAKTVGTGKKVKATAVPTSTLVTKLIKLGANYAENAGD